MSEHGTVRPKYVVIRIREEDMQEDGTLSLVSISHDNPVMIATDPKSIDSPFVLMPRKDPAAFIALVAYASVCEPNLRAEIVQFLDKIVEADPTFGTQGLRNYAELRRKQINLGLQ